MKRIVARDFLKTAGGFYFAVLSESKQKGRYPATLRYIRDAKGWCKPNWQDSLELLRKKSSELLFHSHCWDVEIPGIPDDAIAEHFSGFDRVQHLLDAEALEPTSMTAQRVLRKLVEQGVAVETMGVSGSLLIGAHKESSDVDLWTNSTESFQLLRSYARLQQERQPVSEQLWKSAYERRGCSLSVEEYVWHEKRKFNKFWLDGCKIDLSLNRSAEEHIWVPGRKLKEVEIEAVVVDDARGFDFPAVWKIDCVHAEQLICWTATYTGNAFAGEAIQIRGVLEETESGERRVVVGSSREAPNEFVKVAKH